MAFADPQSVTISGTAISVARTGMDKNAGSFASADGLTKMSVAHQNGKRNRRTIRLDSSKIAADPLLAGVNVKASMSAYLVVDTPLTGYTNAEAKAVVDALVAYLAANTGSKVTQLLGDEI